MKVISALFIVFILFLSPETYAQIPKPSATPSVTERYEKAREEAIEEAKEEPQQKKSTGEKVEDVFDSAGKQVKNTFGKSWSRRDSSRFVVLGDYSFFDLIIPSKIGLTAGYNQSGNTTWELEHLRASLSVPFLVENLGGMKDQRTSIIRRSFLGKNSFNLSYGLTYFHYSIRVGSDILSRINSNLPSGLELIELQALGINLGIGNRWTIQKNITIGIDWLSLSQPVILTRKKSGILDYVSNQNDRDNIGDALNFISYFPRVAAIKLQAGIMF